ncbi:unnamed protein product [Boreogadus saida]
MKTSSSSRNSSGNASMSSTNTTTTGPCSSTCFTTSSPNPASSARCSCTGRATSSTGPRVHRRLRHAGGPDRCLHMNVSGHHRDDIKDKEADRGKAWSKPRKRSLMEVSGGQGGRPEVSSAATPCNT